MARVRLPLLGSAEMQDSIPFLLSLSFLKKKKTNFKFLVDANSEQDVKASE